MYTKKSGHRTSPRVRTPEQQRLHRAEQAARAIERGVNREANWRRIERHLADGPKVEVFHGLTVPAEMVARLWHEPPVCERCGGKQTEIKTETARAPRLRGVRRGGRAGARRVHRGGLTCA